MDGTVSVGQQRNDSDIDIHELLYMRDGSTDIMMIMKYLSWGFHETKPYAWTRTPRSFAWTTH